jgi:hypothetical protein
VSAADQPEGVTGLIESLAVDRLVNARTAAIKHLEDARDSIREAGVVLASFVGLPRINMHTTNADTFELIDDRYWPQIVSEVDRACWVKLFAGTQVTALMDQTTRKELDNKLHDSVRYNQDPLPELTVDNVVATLTNVYNNRTEYFLKCVEAVYRRLSWDHKTNKPARFAPRMILKHALLVWPGDKSVRIDHSGIEDLERVVRVLAKLPPPTGQTGVAALGQIALGQWSDALEHETPGLLLLKPHKIGTIHVQVRADVVDEMNRLIRQRCGAGLPW